MLDVSTSEILSVKEMYAADAAAIALGTAGIVLMENAGLANCRYYNMTGGIVALHVGTKP